MNKLTQQCLHHLYQNSLMGKTFPKIKSSLRRTMFHSTPQMSYLLKHHIHTNNESDLPKTYKVLRSHGYGKEPVFDEIPLPKPGKNQVLIKMAYAPLNPTDMDAMSGIYSSVLQPPYSVGSEGSGVIVAVGEDLKVPLKVGDRVHAIGTGARGEFYKGTIGQYYLNDAETCSLIQDDLTMQEAASHWVNPGTAFYMFLHAQKGNHKAAIHTSGSSALGKMLIKLFKHKGIKLINIVRNDKYIEELMKEGADYVLNSQDPDFEKNLRELAAKEQATIGFDAVCGPLTTKLINCMPRRSTVHVYGMLSGEVEVKVSYFDLVLGKSLKGLLQTNFLAESYEEGKLGEVLNEVHSLLPTVLKTPIQKEVDLREYNIQDLKDAVAFHHKNNAKGRVILRLN